MRGRSLLLALLLLLPGCLDDAPVEGVDGADAAAPDAPASVGSDGAGGVDGNGSAAPRVRTVDGGWGAQAGPLRLQGNLPPEFQVPHEATWILEVVWDPNPTTEEMTFALRGRDSLEFTGASPLRVEFPADAPTGTFSIDGTDPVAVQTYFTAHVSVFDGVPFDPTWSALE